MTQVAQSSRRPSRREMVKSGAMKIQVRDDGSLVARPDKEVEMTEQNLAVSREEVQRIHAEAVAERDAAKAKRRVRRTPEEKIQEGKAKVAARRVREEKAKAKAVAKVRKEKVVTVREDPVDNLFLIRMRAKWAAQREDRRTARLEAALESDPTNTTLAHEVEVAQGKSRKAWEVEAKAMAAFTKARDAAKAKAKAEGKRLVGPVEVSSLPKTAKARSKTAAPVAEPVAEVVVA